MCLQIILLFISWKSCLLKMWWYLVRFWNIFIIFSETCFGPEDSNCLTCRTGLNRELVGSACVCLDHYYIVSGSNLC